jgi:predicted transcriptional regulator
MDNKSSSRKPKPNRTPRKQLNVRLSEELYRRIEHVAEARQEELAKFVGDTLDERTKQYEKDAAKIAEIIGGIADREKSPKKWR